MTIEIHRLLARRIAPVLVAFFILGTPVWAMDGLPEGDPESLGFSRERLARIDAWMKDYTENGKLAGMTVGILRHGKLAYVERFGMSDIEKGTRIDENTLFRIASMTKPTCAVGLMMLFEEGKFLLDDPLYKYLPEFKDMQVYVGKDKNGKPILEPAKRAITIRDLLTHTSGLSYGLNRDDPVDQIYNAADVRNPTIDLPEFIARLARQPLASQPGVKWRYSYAMEVSGRLIEVLTGQDYNSFIQSRLFKPLKMNNTSYYIEDEDVPRMAQLYQRGEDGRIAPVKLPPMPPKRFSREAFISGGAGLFTTLGDYLRFTQMLLNGGELEGVRILGPKTIDLMMMDHTPPDTGPKPGGIAGYGFGLGGAILRDVALSGLPGSEGEYNWSGSASTIFWIDRKEDLALVMMTQMAPADTYPLRKQLRALVYQALIK
jgi:CubicO group peptidase (beta-lactamase class C family)